jgi:hypothetical protein
MPAHWKGQSVDMRYDRCGIDLKKGNGMDFSDSKHNLAELVFQGATESESMQDFSEEAKEALMAWRNRSVPRLSGAELLHVPGCSVFSITYEGQAGEYWPNERENEMTETLIRDFLYRDGICSLTDEQVRRVCIKYRIMALDGDEHVLICPYLTEAGNISGIVVVCVTKMINELARSA